MNEMFSTVIGQIVAAVTGLLVMGIGTVGGFYMKRINDKLKMKTLTDEINRYVSWADQANSFKLMSNEDKRDTVLERIKMFALENDISVTDTQLALMVERSVQSLKSLENVGMRRMMAHHDLL